MLGTEIGDIISVLQISDKMAKHKGVNWRTGRNYTRFAWKAAMRHNIGSRQKSAGASHFQIAILGLTYLHSLQKKKTNHNFTFSKILPNRSNNRIDLKGNEDLIPNGLHFQRNLSLIWNIYLHIPAMNYMFHVIRWYVWCSQPTLSPCKNCGPSTQGFNPSSALF